MKSVVEREKQRYGVMKGNGAEEEIRKKKERGVRRGITRWTCESCRGKASTWKEGTVSQGVAPLRKCLPGSVLEIAELAEPSGATREKIARVRERRSAKGKASTECIFALKLPSKNCSWQRAGSHHCIASSKQQEVDRRNL